MPLTEKGEKIKRSMVKTYGAKKGKQVFYASQNKGTITGTHNPVETPVLYGNKFAQKMLYKKG